MVTACQAVAIVRPPGAPSAWDQRLLWATLALVAIILFGALLIVWINHWRKRAGPEPLSANDQLAHFRELYERGELNQGEFERIRATLAPQLRQELGMPAKGADGNELPPTTS